MKILLIDDHVLFRQGLKFLLSDLSQDVEFVEADSCQNVLPVIEEQQDIDIVLLDLYLPDSNGLEGLGKIRVLLPAATIVVLSSEDNPGMIRAAVEQGAAGFIPKSSTQEVMIAALRLVLAGSVYLPPNALLDLRQGLPLPDELAQGNPLIQLTERQREVLAGAVQGKSNKIIARDMEISEATVKAHLTACFRALGVRNRTEAVFVAANAGLNA